MTNGKFVADVKKAFTSVHKDIQNIKNFFDKLNKKVDLIGEQVDILKRGMLNLAKQTGQPPEQQEGEDVPPEKPEGFDETEVSGEDTGDLYTSE